MPVDIREQRAKSHNGTLEREGRASIFGQRHMQQNSKINSSSCGYAGQPAKARTSNHAARNGSSTVLVKTAVTAFTLTVAVFFTFSLHLMRPAATTSTALSLVFTRRLPLQRRGARGLLPPSLQLAQLLTSCAMLSPLTGAAAKRLTAIQRRKQQANAHIRERALLAVII